MLPRAQTHVVLGLLVATCEILIFMSGSFWDSDFWIGMLDMSFSAVNFLLVESCCGYVKRRRPAGFAELCGLANQG